MTIPDIITALATAAAGQNPGGSNAGAIVWINNGSLVFVVMEGSYEAFGLDGNNPAVPAAYLHAEMIWSGTAVLSATLLAPAATAIANVSTGTTRRPTRPR
jgi:hypothetical protein